MKDRLIHWLVPRLIRLVIVFLAKTIRWQVINKRDFVGNEQCIYAFWHNRLLMAAIFVKIRPVYVLISDHRDGAFIADTMRLFNIDSIRGSSTRGGARALLQMVRKFKQGHCALVITPDGPKGPREKVQMGTVILAKKSGLPVCPFCWATKRCWRITSSWDHFCIPKPFTRGVRIFGETVSIHPDEDNDAALARIQAAMDQTREKAEAYFQ
ncbi:MAG: lysophospholipid acyltransferase family protein [Mariprofundaceae bacterium]|nr:lysophospholipid acyltransferase family protein [Mariprofundaceae bacterium]